MRSYLVPFEVGQRSENTPQENLNLLYALVKIGYMIQQKVGYMIKQKIVYMIQQKIECMIRHNCRMRKVS